MKTRKVQGSLFYWKVRDYEFLRSALSVGLAALVFFFMVRFAEFQAPEKAPVTQFGAVKTLPLSELRAQYPDFDFLYEDPFSLTQRVEEKVSAQLQREVELRVASKEKTVRFDYDRFYKPISPPSQTETRVRARGVAPSFPPLPGVPSIRSTLATPGIEPKYTLRYTAPLQERSLLLRESGGMVLPPALAPYLSGGLLLTLSAEGEVLSVLEEGGDPLPAEVTAWARELPFKKMAPRPPAEEELTTGRVRFERATPSAVLED